MDQLHSDSWCTHSNNQASQAPPLCNMNNMKHQTPLRLTTGRLKIITGHTLMRQTENLGTARSSLLEKPNKTWWERILGETGETQNKRNWTKEKTLEARGQEKNKCSRDSNPWPQKQDEGISYPKEINCLAVYSTPCATFHERSITGRSKGKNQSLAPSSTPIQGTKWRQKQNEGKRRDQKGGRGKIW